MCHSNKPSAAFSGAAMGTPRLSLREVTLPQPSSRTILHRWLLSKGQNRTIDKETRDAWGRDTHSLVFSIYALSTIPALHQSLSRIAA